MFFQNAIKKDNFLKIINFILISFLIIQPVFDLKIFYNSISTLIRVIVVGILFVVFGLWYPVLIIAIICG